ncbi:FAD:protein FMN transferase [Shewanella khirikhana]|uniref:FAD:protein FMN transferase n=1 Tax=Shewanella khirikhana TaxID=1965282 RepID=UPI0030D0E99E
MSIRRARPLLGTFCEICISNAGNASPQAAIEAAFAVIKQIDEGLSFHRPDSELSRLNAGAGNWVELSRHSMRLLRLAKGLGKLSANRFNVTLGAELVSRGALPQHQHGHFLPRGNWQDIELASNKARLKRPVLLTLDGIAKGYAVDLAVACLKHCGIRSGSVNAGGDLKAFGDIPTRVQLRSDEGFGVSLYLCNQALASSRHGAAPTPAYPALVLTDRPAPGKTELHTVIAPFAWRADALTKIAAFGEPGLVRALGGQLPTEIIARNTA